MGLLPLPLLPAGPVLLLLAVAAEGTARNMDAVTPHAATTVQEGQRLLLRRGAAGPGPAAGPFHAPPDQHPLRTAFLLTFALAVACLLLPLACRRLPCWRWLRGPAPGWPRLPVAGPALRSPVV